MEVIKRQPAKKPVEKELSTEEINNIIEGYKVEVENPWIPADVVRYIRELERQNDSLRGALLPLKNWIMKLKTIFILLPKEQCDAINEVVEKLEEALIVNKVPGGDNS